MIRRGGRREDSGKGKVKEIAVGTAQSHHPLPPPVILTRSSGPFDMDSVQKSSVV